MTTPIGRAHLHLPIQDATGAVYSYAQVQFFQPGTQAATTEPIYVQASGGDPITQPLFCDPAVIDVWTANAVRVDIVATVPGNVRITIPGIDIRPDANLVANAPGRMVMSGSQNVATSTILMSLDANSASFQTVDVASTHQHQGDSAGSVVLTDEQATDFDPYQTWVGYHAGENPASNSTGSTAVGPMAELNGTMATILGVGEVTTQPATGTLGDRSVIVSGEDSNASQDGVSLGSANLLRQGLGLVAVGSMNGTPNPSDPSYTPNNTTVVGSGNTVSRAGEVKIGPNHPASGAGANQVAIGNGNSAQVSNLPWAGAQTPVAVGQPISLAGDPSTNTSSDDWFGGVGPLAIGTNATSWNPSLEMLQGDPVTQALLQVTGDASVGGMPTWNNTSQTLGFYGNAGASRSKINYNSTDVAHPLLTSVLNALAGNGLIITNTQPVVLMNMGYAAGAPLEFADTGQALQWSVPAGSQTYQPVNPFTVSGGSVTLSQTAAQSLPTLRNRGIPAIFSAGIQDQTVFGTFTFNPTGVTNLVSNPDFESGTSGWSSYDGDTISQSGTVARFNNYSLRIVPSGTNAWARAGYTVGSVTAGTVYNWSAWVYPTTARNFMISVDAFNGTTYNGSVGTVNLPALPVNQWTRVSTSVTAPSGSPTLVFNVGIASTNGNPATTEYAYVDGAQLTTGAALQPYVDASGFHPDDQFTGIMARCYLSKSVSGGNTIATPVGYLMSRTKVYLMTGLNVTSTLLTLPTPMNSGDVAKISITSSTVTFAVNGTTVGTITDSTLNSRVKCGFRVAESTACTYFSCYPT